MVSATATETKPKARQTGDPIIGLTIEPLEFMELGDCEKPLAAHNEACRKWAAEVQTLNNQRAKLAGDAPGLVVHEVADRSAKLDEQRHALEQRQRTLRWARLDLLHRLHPFFKSHVERRKREHEEAMQETLSYLRSLGIDEEAMPAGATNGEVATAQLRNRALQETGPQAALGHQRKAEAALVGLEGQMKSRPTITRCEIDWPALPATTHPAVVVLLSMGDVPPPEPVYDIRVERYRKQLGFGPGVATEPEQDRIFERLAGIAPALAGHPLQVASRVNPTATVELVEQLPRVPEVVAWLAMDNNQRQGKATF